MAKKRQQVSISQADEYLFAEGTHYEIYKKMGAHLSVEGGKDGVFFAVWAPNAAAVHVIGDFNGWNESSHPMEKCGPGGIHQLFVPGVEEGAMYKYLITTPEGEKLYKADPFANQGEYRPGTASIVADLEGFVWEDAKCREIPSVYIQPLAFRIK